jgi:hypothetical protein
MKLKFLLPMRIHFRITALSSRVSECLTATRTSTFSTWFRDPLRKWEGGDKMVFGREVIR